MAMAEAVAMSGVSAKIIMKAARQHHREKAISWRNDVARSSGAASESKTSEESMAAYQRNNQKMAMISVWPSNRNVAAA